MDIEKLLKQSGKFLLDKMAMAALKAVLPYVLAIGGIALLLFLLYFMIFELPKQSVLGTFDTVKERTTGFFYGTKEETDERLFDEYQSIADRWHEELTAEQESQVQTYALNWQWLAQVDRSLNDPSFFNTFLNENVKEVELRPEETFEEVRPKFTWKNSEIITVKEVCLRNGGEEGEATYKKSTVTERQPVLLLKKAETIQNDYLYTYASETTTETSPSACGELTTTVTQDILQRIEPMYSEDWVPLREILIAHGAKRVEDQDFLLEYWLSYLSDGDGEGDPLIGWSPVIGEIVWPTEGSKITSTFGSRVHPITGLIKLHAGVDIGVPIGTPVYAAKSGKVIFADFLGTAGNAIMIQHDGGMETRYYHLNKVKVESGQTVKAGEEIAESGNTGGSTGPHLHFEVRVNGEPVNPLVYFGYEESSDILVYRPLDIPVLLEWLGKRNSMLATKEILTMIDDAAKAQGIDPYLLIAITGAEQSFVPKSNKYADKIVKNPWNVFGSWKEGKGAELTTKDAAIIAAKTIVKLSRGKPSTVSPIAWLSDPENPNGVYATGSNWVRNVTSIYEQLSKLVD
jgi:murein DD-endopeptidase MepM/ murein hydrolase activator NlpD